VRLAISKLIVLFVLAVSARASTLPGGCSFGVACDTGILSATFAGRTRYFYAYFPAGLSNGVAYPMITHLHAASYVTCGAGLGIGGANGCPSPGEDSAGPLKQFANMNNVAILWVLSTCMDTTSNGGVQPFTECSTSTTGTNVGGWVWDISYFSSYYNYTPALAQSDDLGWISNLIATATGTWGANCPAKCLLTGRSTGSIEASQYGAQFVGSSLSAVSALGMWADTVCARSTSGCDASLAAISTVLNVYIVDGDADTTQIPYCGGSTTVWTGLPTMTVPSQDAVYSYWTGANGLKCTTFSTAQAICSAGVPNASFPGTALATGCTSSARVMFTDYVGHKHTDSGPTLQTLCGFWNFQFPTVACVQGNYVPQTFF